VKATVVVKVIIVAFIKLSQIFVIKKLITVKLLSQNANNSLIPASEM